MEPSDEAVRVGRYLAEFPPDGYADRFIGEKGWANIVEAVWAAEELVNEPAVDADGRRVG